MMKEARTRRNIIDFKCRTIVEYNIDSFYEDDPKIVRILKKRLPKVNVIFVDSKNKTLSKEDIYKRLKG